MYNDIISLKNLHEAWTEFVSDKKYKKDVSQFSLNLSENIFALYRELKDRTYVHGKYQAFSINDPKPRIIHKASVRDRLLHHAIHQVLYPYFERLFIFDSYSCRILKGTHRALNRFRDFGKSASFGHTKTCWVLKCDIRKFFASVDQDILVEIVARHIDDFDTISLIRKVVESFNSGKEWIGLPLGNLTSQLLVNIYMNEFDQFVKHKLKVKYYIRYADDFVILHQDREYLQHVLPNISGFLSEQLKLSLHPDKVSIKTLASGVDFLGWVHFPNHRVLRTATKKRMLRRVAENSSPETLDSYLGLLNHGNGYKLQNFLKMFW